MTSQENVIDRLVDDLEPVNPLSPAMVVGIWVGVATMIAVFFLWVVGLRPDLAYKLKEFPFTFALLLHIATFLGASWLAVSQSFPGRFLHRPGPYAIAVGVTFILAVGFYSGLLAFNASMGESVPIMEAFGCCIRISYGAIIPNLFMILLLSRLAPMESRMTVGFGVVASTVLVGIVSQLNCPIDDIPHVLLGHGLMLMTVGGILYGVYLGLAKFLWRRQLEARKRKYS